MLKNIYCIHDSKGGYGAPVLDDSDELAIRAFHIAFSDSSTMINKYPEDFRLFRLGTYDTKNATFDLTIPVSISHALDFKENIKNV